MRAVMSARWIRATVIFIACTAAACVCAIGIVSWMLYASLRPAAGEWAVPVRVGPVTLEVSVPSALRMATHPLGLRLLGEHPLSTRVGRLVLRPDARGESATIVCDPCVLRLSALGPQALHLSRSVATLARIGQNHLFGELRSGDVTASWSIDLRRGNVDLSIDLPDTDIATLYAVLGPSIPELRWAKIEGSAGASFKVTMPAAQWSLSPRIEGFQVDGLDTVALMNASRLPSCARPTRARDAAAPFGPWLPKAVVAAEDQRFYTHTGFDLVEMRLAWNSDGTAAARGASTITQQLAKLLYAGDERSAVRKARELLYAVELDRTLGKARVLQLYLALAPWGSGDCGAQAASMRLLHKSAARATPVEAAWLASLLRNPRVEIEQSMNADGIDRDRIATILEDMRPMSRAQRKASIAKLANWQPLVISDRSSEAATAASP
jgi:hypothetical protein